MAEADRYRETRDSRPPDSPANAGEQRSQPETGLGARIAEVIEPIEGSQATFSSTVHPQEIPRGRLYPEETMDEDVMERAERVLWIWTGGEMLLLFVIGWMLWSGLFGGSDVLTSIPREIRLAGLGFVVFQLLVPIIVFLDVRRLEDDPGYLWVHVAAMPVLNVFGLFGYLAERGLADEE